MKLIWSKHKTWVKHFYQPFIFVVVQFGDVPAECIARIVGHDQAILYERPSEVAPHAAAIEEDVRASGERLLDPDQKQKRPDLLRNCFNSISQAPHRKELEKKNNLSIKRKVRKWMHTQRSCTDTALTVINEVSQCEKCTDTLQKSLCTCGVLLQELSAGMTRTLKGTKRK